MKTEIPSDEYFAGFFDGEGCIGVYIASKNPSIRCYVTQKFREPLDLFQARFGGIIKPYDSHNHWAWELSGWNKCLEMLVALEPYLTIKKAQATTVINSGWISNKKGGRGNHLSEKQMNIRLQLRKTLQSLKKVYS